jgi:hypothetical protein
LSFHGNEQVDISILTTAEEGKLRLPVRYQLEADLSFSVALGSRTTSYPEVGEEAGLVLVRGKPA